MRRIHTFHLGQMVATPAALAALEESGENASTYVRRHQAADWGEVDKEDQMANDWATDPAHAERLLSAYTLNSGTRIWIITERDRSATTILLPDEY